MVDEAYLSFVENAWDSLALLERGHLVLVRSMTKDYAQTGLRLGFALAAARVDHQWEYEKGGGQDPCVFLRDSQTQLTNVYSYIDTVNAMRDNDSYNL